MEAIFVGGFPIIDLVPWGKFGVIAEELDNGSVAGFEEIAEALCYGFAVGLLGAFWVNGLADWEGFKASDCKAFMHLGRKLLCGIRTIVKAKILLLRMKAFTQISCQCEYLREII
jgi:hypothetical protein